MTIGYSSYENRNYEEPLVEYGPTEHMTKTGVIHQPDLGKRMKEVAKHKIKQAITADPLRSIGEVHEDAVNAVMEGLETRELREEFIHRYTLLHCTVMYCSELHFSVLHCIVLQ